MIKKKLMCLLPIATLLALSGCGTGDSTEVGEGSVVEKYSVIVERGAVYDANVSDANANVATQASDANNTYLFDNEPVYPVTANGGWIDVDGDGILTRNDVALDINLTSYSNVITPTTTYIADKNESIRQERLEQLAYETNSTTDDLLLPPSKANKNSIIVLNAIYEKLIERNNENSKAALAIEAIIQRYMEISNNANIDENATSKEIALAVEQQTMSNLQAKGLIKRLDIDDIKDLKSKRPKKLSDDDESDSEEEYEEHEDDSASDDSIDAL